MCRVDEAGEGEPGELADWSKLPDELFSMVLSHVAGSAHTVVLLAGVCKDWRSNIAEDSQMLKTIPFKWDVDRPFRPLNGLRQVKMCRDLRGYKLPMVVLQAAGAGNASALVVRAKLLDVTGDKTGGMRQWRLAAKGGSEEAMLRYGQALYSGENADQDSEEAYIWLQRVTRVASCQEDILARAACLLGYLCLDGEGTKLDYTEATRYFKLAISNGNLEAERTLGWMFNTGQFA